MKTNQKIIVIVLLFCILIVVGIDIILMQKNNSNTSDLFYQNIDNLNYYKALYKCKKESESITNPKLNISLTVLKEYQFEVTEDNKILYGTFYENCNFKNKQDFDKFLNNIDKNEKATIYVDKKNNTIVGVRSFIYPNTLNDDSLLFTEDYLEVLKNKGFVCEK